MNSIYKNLQNLSLILLKNTENTKIMHRYVLTDNLLK